MRKEKIILVGSGQHANVVLYNVKEQNVYEIAGIVDSDESKTGMTVFDIPVIGKYDNADLLKQISNYYGVKKFFIAFGNMKYRKSAYEYFISNGWESVNIIHPNAVVSNRAKLGKGILIEAGCLITPNPIIGDNVVINTGSQVNHDNIIGSQVYIASGVILSGGVKVGENTLLDDGVIVTLGKEVGENCIIGAGAVVTKDLGDNIVAYGNPARVMRSNI